MALAVGTQLGSHEIIALLGKGGMGEVYRARDLKLKRDVAIKVLPEEFTKDADRVKRFQREAEVLASLNHNNIAGIYDLQEANGWRFLVLELVEGETLHDRLKKGPLPIGDALNIAQRICEALEAAHEKGVVHRDLKPANIKLTPDGDVKVLDFGLAKIREGEATDPNLSHSPTMMTASSMPGMILGTPAYMSPEQARGQNVDRRTDIFAFGCVLFEMLTGQPVFGGEDLMQTLTRVITSEPNWSLLPTNTPDAVGRLLRRALRKDPRQRLGDIRDARIEIEDAPNEETPDTAVPVTTRSARLPWLVAAAMAVAAAVIAIYFMRSTAENGSGEVMRLDIATPFAATPFEFALSPDGRYLVFVGAAESPDNQQRLWLRALDKTEAKPIPGTEGADYPFWSPDSHSVGYFAFNKLYRVDISSGSPQALADGVQGRGGTWNTDGTILYAPGTSTPIFRIKASGGDPVAVTRVSGQQTGHRFPQFLPDGHHFLLFATGSSDSAGIYLASIDSGEPKRLTASDTAGSYLPSGYAVFIRHGALVARRLDLVRGELTGDEVTLADPVAYDTGFNIGGFSVAREGRVAYRASAGSRRQLRWYDRTGRATAAAEPDSNNLAFPELSHDGRRVAVSRTVLGNQDIWILDLLRNSFTRLTSDPAVDQYSSWSPDDMQIAFQSNRKGTFNLYRTSAGGSGADEEILETPKIKSVGDWSKDGRFLLYAEADPATGRDLWVLDLNANPRMPHEFLRTRFEERNGQFSPDGHFVAYETNESGRFEIVVQGFPNPGPKFPVSTNGGTEPRWSSEGKELYFISPDGKLMAAGVTFKGQTIEAGKPSTLFSTHIVGGGTGRDIYNRHEYAVSHEGRFLVNEQIDDYPTPITLILNWKPKL